MHSQTDLVHVKGRYLHFIRQTNKRPHLCCACLRHGVCGRELAFTWAHGLVGRNVVVEVSEFDRLHRPASFHALALRMEPFCIAWIARMCASASLAQVRGRVHLSWAPRGAPTKRACGLGCVRGHVLAGLPLLCKEGGRSGTLHLQKVSSPQLCLGPSVRLECVVRVANCRASLAFARPYQRPTLGDLPELRPTSWWHRVLAWGVAVAIGQRSVCREGSRLASFGFDVTLLPWLRPARFCVGWPLSALRGLCA